MKKILFSLAAAAMVLGAASCQKENLGQIKEVKTVDNPLNTILVKVASDTKLAVDSENLKPAFEENDVIFGWDKEGTTYAYTCTGVAEDVATFTRTSEGAPSADKGTQVNLVFAPGYGIEDIIDKTLDVNLAVQGETLPVVMHATGEVDEQGECNVTFSNDVAIVDIKDAVLPDAVEDEEYTVAFHGKNTSLKFNLNEFGVINYQADVEGPISSSVKAVVGADSKISKKFAVPASLEATDVIITAMAADGSSYTFSAGSKEIVAGKYITVADKEFTAQYVAQIGEDQYTSLAKAVAAANASEADVTIKMLEDVILPAVVTIDNAAKKVTTLDLNGCTIEYEGTSANVITTKTELVVNDAENKGGIKAAVCALRANPGVLTINGGTFQGSGYASGGSGVVYSNGEGSKLTINGGVIKCICGENEGRAINVTLDSFIYGGTISCEGAGFALRQYTAGTCTVDGDNVVIYSNSTYASPVSAPSTNSRINFVNGYVFADSDKDIINNASRVAVTGGHFNKEVAAADGYECVASSVTGPDGRTYTHTVQISTKNVATVTIGGVETGYSKFNDAMVAALAADEATLKLLEDCATSDVTTIANKLTVDLNGNTLQTANATKLQVDGASAEFTVADSSTEGKGTITFTSTGGYVGIDVISGKMVIENGMISSQARGASVRINQGAELIMNGGKLLNVATSTESYSPYALTLKGGKATINSGILSCDLNHVIYVFSEACTLNINGGAFVAKTDGKYPIYATTEKKAHQTTITNSVEEPLFVGGGTGDNEGRIFYNGYSVSKIYTKAGLFTKQYLGKPASPNTYVAEGFVRKDVSVTKTIEGKEYTFIMQVVKKDE